MEGQSSFQRRGAFQWGFEGWVGIHHVKGRKVFSWRGNSMYEKAKVHKKPLLPSLFVLGWGPRQNCQAANSLTLVYFGPHTNVNAPLGEKELRNPEAVTLNQNQALLSFELITRHDFGHMMLAPRSDLPRGPTELPPSFQGLLKTEPLYLFWNLICKRLPDKGDGESRSLSGVGNCFSLWVQSLGQESWGSLQPHVL